MCFLVSINDFNPRSREGSDDKNGNIVYDKDDFNPRSREGSDSGNTSFGKVFSYFNPRSREGSDPGGYGIDITLFDISIHAPARGATISRRSIVRCRLYFNPRSREGSDRYHLFLLRLNPLFQSTLPRGERRDVRYTTRPAKEISIHAPARGATLNPIKADRDNLNFNPRSREGSDSML